MRQATGVEDACQQRLRAVSAYLHYRQIPAHVKQLVKRHFGHCWCTALSS